ncbi:MAG TPA: carotenoid biosynthesis protein [Bacteroidales bacterium]|jgi:putative membrane protein|nr:carotenoid biosynthesis protein [Bacteroidales bacterium]
MTIKTLISEKYIPYTIMFFYLVGLVLFIVPVARDLFYLTIAPSLLLVTTAMLAFHKEWSLKTILVLFTIFAVGIGIEIIGVETGEIFGTYSYQEALGPKIDHVPLMIGLNWVVLTYCSNAIVKKLTKNTFIIVLFGALLMVIYDLVLELVAPTLHMWKFSTPYPPFRNFLGWFLLAVVFHVLLITFKINTTNRVARFVFFIQMVFLMLIYFLDS